MAKTINQLALEVLIGQWGSGDTRKQKLEAAGYDYTTIQNRVNEVAQHMKTRKEAMQPWFEACKAQEQWSYNAKYNWGKWQKTVASSKNWGTCITYPNCVAMRCGMIKEKGKIITSTGSNNDSKSTQDSFYNNSVKAMASINSKYWSSVKYPNKTTTQLVKEGIIKEGDIIGFMGHTAMYAGKDKNGNLLFNHAGHVAGISDNSKPGSNRAVLNVKSPGMSKRLVYGVFSVNTFIVITSCADGTISYSNRYMAGQDVTITIKPNPGKGIKSILVDGKSVSITNSYQIKKIDANHIIEVVCETITQKIIDELAHEVLNGKWGSGDERKRRLLAAGYDYDVIQTRVNELLQPTKTIDELAQEVLNGEWGSGDERKRRLTEAGYDYEAVQAYINELLAKSYHGTLPTTKLIKSNAEVIADTIKWAKWIAGDNNFHYGYTNAAKGANAHHNGCYFCGTQRMKKNMLMPEHTYCCNPFVGAAWAHGGCVPTALKMCQNTNSWNFAKGSGYDKSSLFDNLGHPAKSKLKPGDVLCRDTHVALYIGNGKIAEAGGGDDNKKNSTKWNNSIRVRSLTDTNYKNFPRVHRYNGSVNTNMYIRHGEVGQRVALWQMFLDWYFDGQVGSADGYFGDNTLKWTKKFQEEVIGTGEGDGVVGQKTLDAAAKVRK